MFSVVYNDTIAVASVFDDIPPNWLVVDCRPLIDGDGNAMQLVEGILAVGLGQLNLGRKVCFACDYGHSRSNYLAALAISRHASISLGDAITLIKEKHVESCIKPTLLRSLIGNSSEAVRKNAFAITGADQPLGRLLLQSVKKMNGGFLPVSLDVSSDADKGSTRYEEVLLLNRITDLIHSAYPDPPNSYLSSKQSYVQFVDILQACIAANCVFHYISSWSVFEASTDHVVVESSRSVPFSLYSQARCLQEQQLIYAAQSSGLRFKIYRVPCLLSRDSILPRFLTYFAHTASSGKPIFIHRYSNGYPVVPLMSLEVAVCQLAQQMLTPRVGNDIIHVCRHSCRISVAELGRQIARNYGVTVFETPVERNAFTGSFHSQYHFIDSPSPSGVPAEEFDPMDYVQSYIRTSRHSSLSD